jgi:protein phosphatase
MGATVCAAYFTKDTLIVANVGDSPVYLIHKGQIELLSVIHNVISEQQAIYPDAAYHIAPQFRHMLTRAMGLEETVRPDICEIQFFKGDALVLSSDGLTDKVAPNEILDVIVREKVEKACRTLVNLANSRGGEDNITVIAIKVTAVNDMGSSFLAKLIHRLVFWKKDG